MTKVVVVTGASAGIGRATAIEFAKQGYRIALLARGKDGLQGALRDVQQAGGEGLIIPVDMADSAQVEAAADEVERTWGPIDIWVNNAMVTIIAPFVDIEPDDFRRATEVTYLGAVWGTRAALKRMKPRDRGVIVQVGSALGYRSIPLQSPYCGAKSALIGFTDSLRCELIHDRSNVKLTMVVLAGFNTPQFEWARTTFARQPKPLGRFFQPEVAAEAICWAAAHPRLYSKSVAVPSKAFSATWSRPASWTDCWHGWRTAVSSAISRYRRIDGITCIRLSPATMALAVRTGTRHAIPAFSLS